MHSFIQRIEATSKQLIEDLRIARLRLLTHKDPEALHDLRVGIRRLRSTLLPFARLPGMDEARQALKPFKKLADATNAIRDAEVQDALLLPLAESGDNNALADWRARLARETRQEKQGLAQRLEKSRWKKRLKTLEKELVRGLDGCNDAEIAAQLGNTYRTLVVTLHAELSNLDALFDSTARWHRARLDCKRLRYLLDGYGAALSPDWTVLVAAAKAAQESLGGLRDWEVLRDSLAHSGLATDTSWMSQELAARRQLALRDTEALGLRLAAEVSRALPDQGLQDDGVNGGQGIIQHHPQATMDAGVQPADGPGLPDIEQAEGRKGH